MDYYAHTFNDDENIKHSMVELISSSVPLRWEDQIPSHKGTHWELDLRGSCIDQHSFKETYTLMNDEVFKLLITFMAIILIFILKQTFIFEYFEWWWWWWHRVCLHRKWKMTTTSAMRWLHEDLFIDIFNLIPKHGTSLPTSSCIGTSCTSHWTLMRTRLSHTLQKEVEAFRNIGFIVNIAIYLDFNMSFTLRFRKLAQTSGPSGLEITSISLRAHELYLRSSCTARLHTQKCTAILPSHVWWVVWPTFGALFRFCSSLSRRLR